MEEKLQYAVDILSTALQVAYLLGEFHVVFNQTFIRLGTFLKGLYRPVLGRRTRKESSNMATTVTYHGVSTANVAINNLKAFVPSDWVVLSSETLVHNDTSGSAFAPVYGSKTIYRNTSDAGVDDAVIARLEVNPGRDAEGIAKFNCSLRFTTHVVTDVDGTETHREPSSLVIAWTSLRSPIPGGDTAGFFAMLANATTFLVPDIVTGGWNISQLDSLLAGVTEIDLANVTRS